MRITSFDSVITKQEAANGGIHSLVQKVEKEHLLRKLSATGDSAKERQIDDYYAGVYSRMADILLHADALDAVPSATGEYRLTDKNKKLIRNNKKEMQDNGMLASVQCKRVLYCSKCYTRLTPGEIVYHPDKDIDSVCLCINCCSENNVVNDGSSIGVVH